MKGLVMCHFRFAACAVAVFVAGALNISLLTAQAPKEATGNTVNGAKKEIAWRIVSIGKTDVSQDWEENRLGLQSDREVVGPMVESSDFLGFEKSKVTTEDFGESKVTKAAIDANSHCHYALENSDVRVVVEFSWISATSTGSGGATFNMKSGTSINRNVNLSTITSKRCNDDS